MDDLIARIRAAIDQDERWACSARPDFFTIEVLGVFAAVGDARHVLRHDPARVLRHVAAHRKLLEGHDGVHRCDWGEHRGGEFGPCKCALILAEAYGIEP